MEEPESSGAFVDPPGPWLVVAYLVCLATTVTGTLVGAVYKAIARIDHPGAAVSSWDGELIGAGAGAGLGVAVTFVAWLWITWRGRSRAIRAAQ